MALFQPPEISTIPLEDILLQMRALGVNDVENFPFPTAPPVARLKQALDLLVNLGAIEPPFKSVVRDKEERQRMEISGGRLTEMGKLLSKFPLTPRLSKILVVGQQSQLLCHALTLVAALTEKSPFLYENHKGKDSEAIKEEKEDEEGIEDEEEITSRQDVAKQLSFHPESDALARLRALGAYSYFLSTSISDLENDEEKEERINSFCALHSLLRSNLDRMLVLRTQLSNICIRTFQLPAKDVLQLGPPPSPTEEEGLKQVLFTAFCDCLVRKAPPLTRGSRRMKLTGKNEMRVILFLIFFSSFLCFLSLRELQRGYKRTCVHPSFFFPVQKGALLSPSPS